MVSWCLIINRLVFITDILDTVINNRMVFITDLLDKDDMYNSGYKRLITCL